jgi:serine/threonine protein kinase
MRALSEIEPNGLFGRYLNQPLPDFEFVPGNPDASPDEISASSPDADSGAVSISDSELISRALEGQANLHEVGDGRSGSVRRLHLEFPFGARDFAGKFYDREDTDGGFLSLFDQVLAQFGEVSHPCVARIVRTEAPTDNSGPVIWTHFFTCGSLDSYLKSRRTNQIADPWTATERVFVICGIVAGLKALHDSRLFHGRSKPSGVLFGPNFQVSITDYLSYSFEHYHFTVSPSDTNPCYTAPDCYGFEDEHFDIWNKDCVLKFQRVDVFALGLILYEILTGKQVFSSELSAGEFRRKIHGRDLAGIRSTDWPMLGF